MAGALKFSKFIMLAVYIMSCYAPRGAFNAFSMVTIARKSFAG